MNDLSCLFLFAFIGAVSFVMGWVWHREEHAQVCKGEEKK